MKWNKKRKKILNSEIYSVGVAAVVLHQDIFGVDDNVGIVELVEEVEIRQVSGV